MKLKEIDMEILRYLEEDARISLREIAGELDVSPTTISNRVKNLKENGVIEKFSLKVDLPKLGYGLTAIINLKAHGSSIPQVVQKINDHPSVTHVYEITGDFDILVIGKFENREEMNEEIKDLLSNPNIEETNTSVVLSTVKEYENSGLI